MREQSMDRKAIRTIVMAVTLLGIAAWPGPVGSTAQDEALSLRGLWFGTVFFGDPSNPSTPKEQFFATIAGDGTYILDSTAETGEHALNPGDKTPEHGVWTRRGSAISTRGFFFDEVGGGAGFSVGRGVSRLEFVSLDQLSGLADFDFLPCGGGPLGCPNPVAVAPLELGDGLGPFPVELQRVR
jgi:hypothetical protein